MKFIELEIDGVRHAFPSILQLCDVCEGEGQVENPAFDNGFTSSEWQDMDEEEQQQYLGGAYDVTCSCCRGSGRVRVPDVDACTFAKKRLLVEYRAEQRAVRDVRNEQLAEQRFFNA